MLAALAYVTGNSCSYQLTS